MRFALALLLVVAPAAALAESEEQPGTVLVVQKRQYQMSHELAIGAGYLPIDAFYKGITGHVGYTYHFSDHFGWQLGRAAFSRNTPTNLRTQLEREFQVVPTEFPEVQWIVGSDLVWSPLYGKTAFMNRSVLYMQLFFVAGGSGVKVQADILPGVNVGMGLRFFATERISLKIEGSNHLVLGKRGVLSVVDLGAALALNFGSGR